MLLRDIRLVRALLVPAACFILCTVLRPLIGRERPYDRFHAQPVGSYRPGKGKSLPSRHTASAAAIAFAVIWLYPAPAVITAMGALCLMVYERYTLSLFLYALSVGCRPFNAVYGAVLNLFLMMTGG